MRWASGRVLAVLALAACSVSPPIAHSASQAQEAQAQEPDHTAEALRATAAHFDLGRPYLGGPLPGGDGLIHPMPQDGDARMASDLDANARALAMRGTPRWELAERDADLGTGWYDQAFAEAAGVPLDAESSPAIARVLRRAATDFAMSTGAVKDQFQRQRPFMVNGEGSCTPSHEPLLRTNGSYPSGHSAIGYGTGLVLASIFEDRAAVLIARGRDFGDSRWICNVHWQSDVEEGRAFAAATFARLQANADFQADLAAAREEAHGPTELEQASD